MAVPRFADFVTVDLAEAVLRGEEPAAGGSTRDAPHGRSAASATTHRLYPARRADPLRPVHAAGARLRAAGRPVLEPRSGRPRRAGRPRTRSGRARIVDYGIHSLIAVPLRARGVLLGVANFWRSEEPEPFEEDDLSLAEELAARAAVCIDNARRYTREHTMAVTLQRSLLPRAPARAERRRGRLPLSARAQAGVGGDWFDVIPLPGARVALVVGDVVGHGLHAAATMGRLRTAVHNFAALDLPPDELLSHLDDLVARIDQDEARRRATAPRSPAPPACTRSTTRSPGAAPWPAPGIRRPRCVHPDGTRRLPRRARRPAARPGRTALRDRRAATARGQPARPLHRRARRGPGPGHRRRAGAAAPGPGARRTGRRRRPARRCSTRCCPPRPSDDIALLVARTRVLDADQVADWDVPSDPAAVAGVRGEASPQAGRLGPGGGGLHHRADPQRAGHQRHPLRRRARSGCG